MYWFCCRTWWVVVMYWFCCRTWWVVVMYWFCFRTWWVVVTYWLCCRTWWVVVMYWFCCRTWWVVVMYWFCCRTWWVVVRCRSEESYRLKRFIEAIIHTCSIRLSCCNVIEASYSVAWLQIPTNRNKTYSKINICRDITATPAYGVNISQQFRDRGLVLTRKLLNQGFLLARVKSSLRKF